MVSCRRNGAKPVAKVAARGDLNGKETNTQIGFDTQIGFERQQPTFRIGLLALAVLAAGSEAAGRDRAVDYVASRVLGKNVCGNG